MVSDVLLLHKGELWILNKFSEADHESPRIWTTSLESFKEDLTDLFVNDLSVGS